jgi:hypothetical protein
VQFAGLTPVFPQLDALPGYQESRGQCHARPETAPAIRAQQGSPRFVNDHADGVIFKFEIAALEVLFHSPTSSRK